MKSNQLQLIIVALVTLCGSALAATDYNFIALECCGGATAIASNGLVAGETGGFGSSRFWDTQGKRLYSDPEPYTYGYPYSINKSGMALVNANENGEGYFFWNNGVFSMVPAAINYPQQPGSINDSGQVAVQLTNGHIGLWENGVLTDLGTISGGSASWARVITNKGEIVGSALTVDGLRQAVLWSNNSVVHLGVLPGDALSDAWNVTDSGDVIGFSYSATTARPFRWHNGVMVEMASADTFVSPSYTYPPSKGVHAIAMNSKGQIIANDNSASDMRALVWENGVITDLNPLLGYVPGMGGCRVTAINNTGIISGACFRSNSVVLTPAVAGVNLSLQLLATPGSIIQGNLLSYILNVTNLGSLTATNVQLTDALPTTVSLVSAVASQGSCAGTGVINCALGDLATNATTTVQINVIPNVTGSLINTASVSSVEEDGNFSNNSATSNLVVNAPVVNADVGVTLSSSASSVSRLSKLIYTVQIINNGPASANNVLLKDILPTSMKFVSASTTTGTCSGTATVSCNIGTMAGGSTANITIVVTASSRGTFTNTANVSTTSNDINTSNNSSKVTTTVK